MQLSKFFFGILCLWLVLVCQVQAYYDLGKPTGHLNDYAKILSPETAAEIETQLTQFRTDTTHEIAIVIIDSMQGDYIENFSLQLARNWGIGSKENDNGVLFYVALEKENPENRGIRIEVGRGLEGVLTDLESSWIIDQIIPYFKTEDYNTGIKVAADSIMQAIKEEVVTKSSESGNDIFIIVLIAIILLAFFIWIASQAKKGGKGKPGRGFEKSSGTGIFGGGFGSSSGSSGGFGGFGGGSFGGGGASGRR